MKTVVLVRHGKPNYESDRRELSEAGVRQIERTAREIAEEGVTPELILFSPILRTRQTAALLGKAFPEAALKEDRRLMEAGLDMSAEKGIRAALADVDDAFQTIAVVSHKDHLHVAILGLTGEPLFLDYGEKMLLRSAEGSWNGVARSGGSRIG